MEKISQRQLEKYLKGYKHGIEIQLTGEIIGANVTIYQMKFKIEADTLQIWDRITENSFIIDLLSVSKIIKDKKNIYFHLNCNQEIILKRG